MADRTCVIEGCDKPRRSAGADWCKMHYHRWYRHGSTDKVATASPITASLGRRYRTIGAKGHPMAMANGRAYEHRVVLYDAIGPGPHACHWCSAEVDWLTKGDPANLLPDHVNGDGADNRIANLVPSCMTCNTARGSQARHDALRAAGWWSNNDTIAGLAGGRRQRVGGAGQRRNAPTQMTPADKMRVSPQQIVGQIGA
jgi:hypothetical protein